MKALDHRDARLASLRDKPRGPTVFHPLAGAPIGAPIVPGSVADAGLELFLNAAEIE